VLVNEHREWQVDESPDGRDHEYDHGNRWLLGARGSWSVVDETTLQLIFSEPLVEATAEITEALGGRLPEWRLHPRGDDAQARDRVRAKS